MKNSLSPVRSALRTIKQSGCGRLRQNENLPVALDRPDRPYPTEVLLLLDAHSRIQYCGEGLPFLCAAEDVIERPLNSLIRGLPLREGTPGYNIAYVRCSFADNAWQRHLINADNRLLTVDLHLRTLHVADGYFLLGMLRFVSADKTDAPANAARPDRLDLLPGMANPLPSCA